MDKFNIGDLVILISDQESAIPMTVQGYLKDEPKNKEALLFGWLTESDKKMVRCFWRDANQTPYSEYYHEDSLTKVD